MKQTDLALQIVAVVSDLAASTSKLATLVKVYEDTFGSAKYGWGRHINERAVGFGKPSVMLRTRHFETNRSINQFVKDAQTMVQLAVEDEVTNKEEPDDE